jgi:hypothetical protein
LAAGQRAAEPEAGHPWLRRAGAVPGARGRRVVKAAVHKTCAVVAKAVVKTVKAAASFVKKHAAAIASIAAGVAVFAGCTALTAGAGVIACGALAGVVSSAITQGAKCADGQKGACSVASFAKAAVIGGVTGAVGGAIGAGALGAVADSAAGAVAGGADDASADVVSETAASAADGPPAAVAKAAGKPAGEGEAGPSCGGASFTAGTRVLLAGGGAKAISRLRAGQKVLATNTKTGKTSAGTVAAVLVHHDANRYDLTVRTARGTAVIGTTSNHLFWDQGARRWVKAGALKYGTRLRAPSGGTVTAAGGGDPAARSGWMWDLTIPGDHDFYIQATRSTAILVHNCGTDALDPWQAMARVDEHVMPLHGPHSEATGSNFVAGTTREDVANMVDRGLARSASDATGNHAHLVDLGLGDIGTVTNDAGVTKSTSWVKIWMNDGNLGTIHPTLERP